MWSYRDAINWVLTNHLVQWLNWIVATRAQGKKKKDSRWKSAECLSSVYHMNEQLFVHWKKKRIVDFFCPNGGSAIMLIILKHFVVVIFSSRMYAQQVFSPLFTGVLNTIACLCRRGVSGVFPTGLSQCIFPVWGIRWGEGSVFPFFTGGWCACVVCVCIRTRTYAAREVLGCEPGCRDETPGELGRNPNVL